MSTPSTAHTVKGAAAVATRALLPRGPVLGWASFKPVSAPKIVSVENLQFTAFTTSGRAAIYHALLQLKLPAQSTVLVPTYHCPTMVAPVFLANLQVAYFGISDNGLPNLESIDPASANSCRAMLVSHYFGVASSLAKVRRWCDDRGIALIEDCAHCYFGQAGERPIGAWGDFSTASLTKFFPVPEAGILASATRQIHLVALSKPGWKMQLKGWVDIVELATRYGRFLGLNRLLALGYRVKNSRSGKRAQSPHEAVEAAKTGENEPTRRSAESLMQACDMARMTAAPLAVSMLLRQALPHGRIIANRQRNYALYSKLFQNVRGARVVLPIAVGVASQTAPYVFGLWVDDADVVYHALRAQGLPVFRWDRVWPGTPQIQGDVGLDWSRHVLQLLCHQDLDETAIAQTARAVLALVTTSR